MKTSDGSNCKIQPGSIEITGVSLVYSARR
jgi:hypothetical protein